ncbi:MAG: SPOR domain-containing protein [Anaeromyxobacter sp.]|nr:SPOR domain-containing protein [Anaeromyxobacter sp.]MBL0277777.1 SPOR domain-containing protein [Anaeromyxobacter sp.]
MDGDNVKVRDRVELALDGRQIASVVVGALVLLGVVFVLGLNIGRQLAVKQLEATRGDALAALDEPPATPAGREDALTFHDRLTRDRVPPPEEPVQQAAPPAPAAVAVAAVAMAQPAPAAVEPAPAGPPAATAAAPAVASPASRPAARGAFAVQVVATPSKVEADRLAGKLKAWSPRVEAAEISGKGRLYRVRVGGAFTTKPEAERFLKGFTARSGAKGLVVASR